MKRIGIISLSLMMALSACSKQINITPDTRRISELEQMPVLWESEIVVADPAMPEFTKIIPLFDSHDGSLIQAMQKDKFTKDYIPEAVMAFASETYRDKPRTITLEIGDKVAVLEAKKNNTGKKICLIRTQQGTYAWLYSFQLLNEKGKRMGRLQ